MNGFIQKPNLKSFLNQLKMNENRFRENNRLNLIKSNAYNNPYKLTSNDSFENLDENAPQVVSKILDNINKNSLSAFYEPDSEFKNKIDTLNLKFYLETEKYLSNQKQKIKTQTSLFIILFKQIIIYIKEIERLNLIIIQKKYEPENIIKRTDDIAQKQKEFQTKEDIINVLKKSQSNLESKLLLSFINENNLNKKIEQLQKENDFFRNIIGNITTKNKNEKNDKIISENFDNDKNDESYIRYNKNNFNENHYRNNNVIKINKRKNSHHNNSICITNSSTNQINNIKIRPINIKSKSPSNYNRLKSSFKLQKIITFNNNMTRNNSEKDNKLRNNINKTIYQFKNNIQKQIHEKMKYKGYLITSLDKNENINMNNYSSKRLGLVKNDKNTNRIKSPKTEPNLIKENHSNKITIPNGNKLLKEDNITFNNIKKHNNNSKINSFLSNSNFSSNISLSKKQKNEFDINKSINAFNTIDNYTSKDKSENNSNYYKLVKSRKKVQTFININKSNNNIRKCFNKNKTNNKRMQFNIKKGKNNQSKIKTIINISSSVDIEKK